MNKTRRPWSPPWTAPEHLAVGFALAFGVAAALVGIGLCQVLINWLAGDYAPTASTPAGDPAQTRSNQP